jgi:RNA polymerase sigma-70 factor (ECF subfamily)
LLRRLREGDKDAATILYVRYAEQLRGVARARCTGELSGRVDPEEIVQSAFRTFFHRAAEGHYQVPAGETLWKLLLVITLNKIRSQIDYHRAAKRDPRLHSPGERASTQITDDESPMTVLRMTVEEALALLPPDHRRMMALRIEGYSVAEIATKTRRSRRTVERVLQECRKTLGNLLKPEE